LIRRRGFLLRRRPVARRRLLYVSLRRAVSLGSGRLALTVSCAGRRAVSLGSGWLAVFAGRRRAVSLGSGWLGLGKGAARNNHEEKHQYKNLSHKSSTC